MLLNDVRKKYLEFFEKRGHSVIPSASLVPQNDPTTLFTGSGMQPLLPYLLGEPHPQGARLSDSQKSFRAEDIEEVGDNRHTTFFEMLGNWSLGDYFKREQLPWFFEFLTEEVGIDAKNLYVTVFIGDPTNGIPRDEESAKIWQQLFAKKGIEAKAVEIGTETDGYEKGMQDARIFYYDARKNWWSRAGVPENMPGGEPGGPDSEVFYDFGVPHNPKFGKRCHPNCDCGRFIEIGNSVFMQYIKRNNGSFTLLPKANVDFGGGLERITAASLGIPDVFQIDVFKEIIDLLVHFSKKSYDDASYQRSFRIIADHMRAAVMMLADGVRPGNSDRSYVLRRLLRRSSQHAGKLGFGDGEIQDSMLIRTAVIIIEKYKGAYPELDGENVYETIRNEIWKEEVLFAHALERGMREFEKWIWIPNKEGVEKLTPNKHGPVGADKLLPANVAFNLFTTHGFPIEMTVEVAAEKGLQVDLEGFKKLMRQHSELSRSGSEQKFKGGLADHSEKTTRLHTAHHLLLKALQIVLGPSVKQRGSNITQERLRIDFSWGQKMSKEQIAEVERIVNDKIKENLPVVRSELDKEEAERLGAEHEFGAKYPDRVSVYSVGPGGASLDNPQFESAFSIEFCGGPHVTHTDELLKSGVFKIQKEEAVASGIRRIKAVLY